MLTNCLAACAQSNYNRFSDRARYWSKIVIFSYPLAFDVPVRGVPVEQRHTVWYGKTRMAWLPDGEKISKISLFVLAQLTNVTDRRTDNACRQQPHLCIAAKLVGDLSMNACAQYDHTSTRRRRRLTTLAATNVATSYANISSSSSDTATVITRKFIRLLYQRKNYAFYPCDMITCRTFIYTVSHKKNTPKRCAETSCIYTQCKKSQKASLWINYERHYELFVFKL